MSALLCLFLLFASAQAVRLHPHNHVPTARRGLLAAATSLGPTPLPASAVYTQLNASQTDVLQFVNGLQGTVVLQGQLQYDAARNLTQLINVMYNDRAPALVVFCASQDDVASAVRFAAQRGVPLCVRAGGHDSTGACICDGGVVVDVTGMKQIDVFPERGEAVLGAGVRFRDFVQALSARGFAALTGDCPDVGIAGYTLGGGWGKLTKSRGLGVDNVVSYSVVLPDGRAVVANATGEYQDLFWAMRGAGHQNFGVLTGLTYRVFRQAEVLTWNATWDAQADPQKAAEVLLTWQDAYLDKGPRALSFYPHFSADQETGEQLLVLYAVYTDLKGKDPEARLRKLVQPLADLQPQASAMQREPWSQLTGLMDALEDPIVESAPPPDQPPPMWELKLGQYVDRRLNLREMRSLVDGWASKPAFPKGYSGPAWTYAYLEPVEGAAAAVAPDAMAYPHRGVGFDVVTDTFFLSSPGAKDAAQAWLNGLYDRRWKGILNGLAYGNYPSDSYGSRAPEMYWGSNLCRLVELKNKYDPTGVFDAAQGVPLQHPGCQ